MRIVYDSFGGQYSDSPRALHEALLERRPGDEHVWVADARTAAAFPPGTRTVRVGTPEHVAALEGADVLVANSHTYVDWVKRPKAVYLQTWHGTPLKRIHGDALTQPAGGLDVVTRDAARWDYLVSPNPHSTRVLRDAFGFRGTVLETGYPRNDLLSAPDRDAVRARARHELGIEPGRTAVLYLPTYREDLTDTDGRLAYALQLDVADFVRRLGADHVLLLRLHYFLGHLPERPAERERGQVLDVSAHPDLRELYLAADVLVTDYSSAMFDFAVTGRPMVFFAYDLEHYRDELRGFYLDFETEVPGPVVRTSAGLVDALLDLDAVSRAYAERYAAFRARFCALEDGGATGRVLDAVLGPTAPGSGVRVR